jgi:uncharacterized protein YfkK (UPF0435 family)
MFPKLENIDSRIVAFYKANLHIDFNTVNLMFIDLFEKATTPKPTIESSNHNLLHETIQTLNTNITEKILDLQKENAVRQQLSHAKFVSEIGEMFKKHSQDGVENMNIQQMGGVLNKMYNTAEFVLQSSAENSVRFSMKRYLKPVILFECVDIEDNVNTDKITDFYKWVEEKNSHGVFVSQRSGFSSKPNYFIEYHRGNIVVFVHSAAYCPEKIKIAVDVIDTISTKLKELNTGGRDENTISKSVLDEINKEYQLFISQKEALINLYKDCQKKVLSQIDEIRFPCLDKYLSTKYTNTVQKPGFKCDMCKAFNANNLKALAAHKRGCARKMGGVKPTINELRQPLSVVSASS